MPVVRHPWLVARACAALVVLLAGTAHSPAEADAGAVGPAPEVGRSSLPSVGSGHRPGPDVLYAPAAEAPQLQNVGSWRASPILVSGAAAYRDGEFLYQDYLHDDHGARGTPDPTDPARPYEFLFAPKAGTLTYPTDSDSDPPTSKTRKTYANNSADLVELRVGSTEGSTAFRVTRNTMTDPGLAAFTIALGSSLESRAWPHAAGVRSPAAHFLTVHGGTAQLVDAATGRVVHPRPQVRVDQRRRQVDVRIPASSWDPGTGRVRIAAGVGLWDAARGRYLTPAGVAGPGTPGGASPSGAALFNVAFRYQEPLPDVTGGGAARTLADAAVAADVDGAWWRERGQAEALRRGDISEFFEDVDFGKLRDRVADESKVPTSGPINRLFASRSSFGQGVDHNQLCGRATPCVGPFVGQLQPYSLYVPKRQAPESGWGLTLWLHSWTANHNQYTGSKNQSQLGERGLGSLVATPLGRGPDGPYGDMAEADVFEVWADVARRYPLDPARVATGGYSMGSAGGFDLPARYPDLFSRAVVAAAVPEGERMTSLRHVPIMTWIGHLDEGTDLDRQERAVQQLAEAGLHFVFDQFPTADHLTLAANDEWGPVAEFLGDHRVVRDPHRITYVVAPEKDSARARSIADHAYWISDLRVRDRATSPTGEIDALSGGFGAAEGAARGVTSELRLLHGGAHGPMPYRRREQVLAPAGGAPRADRLVLRVRNLRSATVDVQRARVSCQVDVEVRADGPFRLNLVPCGRSVGSGTAGYIDAARPPRTARLPATGGDQLPAACGVLLLLLLLVASRLRRSRHLAA